MVGHVLGVLSAGKETELYVFACISDRFMFNFHSLSHTQKIT